MTIEVRPFDASDEQARAAAFALNRRAFNSPESAGPRWTASLAHSFPLAAWDGGELAGFARVKPYQQWYGGRPVPMAGVASVTVAPAYRGQGVARALVLALLDVMREQALPVSTLFPTTSAVYRKFGWEAAGHHQWITVPPESLAAIPAAPDVTVRAAAPGDADAIAACYERRCRESAGLLDRRGPFFDVAAALAGADEALVVTGARGEVEGYLLASRRALPDDYHHFVLSVDDLVATTGAAQRALWRVLSSFASVVSAVEAQVAPDDALLLLTGADRVEVTEDLRWMLRVVDLPAAIAARGWPAGAAVTVDLDVRDEHVPANAGRWRLSVADGQATAGRVTGGPSFAADAVSADARALGPLYTGYADPFALRRAGLLDGPDAALLALRTAFAGPVPHQLDYF